VETTKATAGWKKRKKGIISGSELGRFEETLLCIWREEVLCQDGRRKDGKY